MYYYECMILSHTSTVPCYAYSLTQQNGELLVDQRSRHTAVAMATASNYQASSPVMQSLLLLVLILVVYR